MTLHSQNLFSAAFAPRPPPFAVSPFLRAGPSPHEIHGFSFPWLCGRCQRLAFDDVVDARGVPACYRPSEGRRAAAIPLSTTNILRGSFTCFPEAGGSDTLRRVSWRKFVQPLL